MGIQVAYLPGLAMRRIADLHPGTAKTDARDAYVIAESARTLPHTLRRVDAGEETLGGPQGMASAGETRLLRTATKANPRRATELVDAIGKAIGEQTVTVPGTAAADTVLPKLAGNLASVLDQRAEIAAQVEQVLDAPPLAEVLTSMPGVGARTAARILLDVGDGSAFRTAGHLAACAGLAPVTRRSGTSIRGEFPARSGNKHLKRALFLSAFAALSRPRQPRLLRPETSPRQEAQRRTHLPSPAPSRCPVRHAQKPRALPGPRPTAAAPRSLTRNIGPPPRCDRALRSHGTKRSPRPSADRTLTHRAAR